MKSRILIVDDQPHFSHLLRLMLEKTGELDVREITQPQQVAEAVQIFQPDLLILDLEMPGMNGADLADKMIRAGKMPVSSIVFLSGLIEPQESGWKETPNGPMRFLSKTAPPLKTMQAIREALSVLQSAA